jgi:hypothetical protein
MYSMLRISAYSIDNHQDHQEGEMYLFSRGSQGPAWPLSGVRGVPAPSPPHRRRR